jgi:hypothetical protein
MENSMSRFRSVLTAAAGVALMVGADARAQQAPSARALGNPSAVFDEPFSDIAGLRQLSDGRLLVSDRLEKAIRVLDPGGRYVDDVGSVGSGPGEYQIPGDLLPLPGDSTLLVDFGNMRLRIIGPDGRIHRSTSMQQSYRSPDGGSGVVMVMPRTIDARGRLYFDTRGSFTMDAEGPPDSSAIVRWELESARFDTVGMLPNPALSSISMGGRGGVKMTSLGGGPLSPRAGWIATRDGRTALVWPEPYHAEWISDAGTRTAGAPVAYRPIRVTDADKNAWAEGMGGGAVTVVSSSSTSGGNRSFTMPKPDPDDMDWPEYKPPFQPRGLWAAPDGSLWVQRYVRVGAPEEFDVFDGSGNLADRIVFPEGRRLIGFGAGVAYLIRTDADDLQWIERYVI